MNNKIKELYDLLELNRFQFSTLIGYDNSSVISAERKNKISRKMAKAILQAFPHVNRTWLETGKGEMFRDAEVADVTTLNESRPLYGAGCGADIVCRMVCKHCAESPVEDREAYLMLKAILESDQEGTKLAIKQNLKEFVRLVKPPADPERNAYSPHVKGLSPPAGAKRGKRQ